MSVKEEFLSCRVSSVLSPLQFFKRVSLLAKVILQINVINWFNTVSNANSMVSKIRECIEFDVNTISKSSLVFEDDNWASSANP